MASAASAPPAGGRRKTRSRRLSALGYRRPWLRALALLSPPLAAFLFFYIAALAVLFISAFWTVNEFTGELIHHWTFGNFRTLWSGSAYHSIALRTIGIAAAVTVTDALIAFPFAYFMARVASRRLRGVMFVMVLLPLWSSYLLRVYAWRLILDHDGLLNWSLRSSVCRRRTSPTRTWPCGWSSPTSGCRS